MLLLVSRKQSSLSLVAQFLARATSLYFTLRVTTTLILILAANTSYADFPRLASLLARDRFAPIQFMHRGDRLVFSNGIALLTVTAIALLIAFDARELRLISLYAVGVFLSFTLSQTGMVWHWRRHRERSWRRRAAMNALGATATMGCPCGFHRSEVS